MKWQQGRSVVEGMLSRKELERVPASRYQADNLLAQASNHLKAAQAVVSFDAIGAYQLLYDAARKALVAVLENQGLRPTSRGGHIAVLEAVSAQLDPPLGAVLRPFDRMRRRRNQAEYADLDSPRIEAQDVASDAPKVTAIIELAERVLDEMSPF
ncbi:HEPN domain-containing protein [Kitasatospora sp. NPDC088779]|uniref:HEPN domain-containing protein n=1 Tax=Kitasatospora sp. NPDC088779 TaxID=3154964 RepID=UPI003428B46B